MWDTQSSRGSLPLFLCAVPPPPLSSGRTIKKGTPSSSWKTRLIHALMAAAARGGGDKEKGPFLDPFRVSGDAVFVYTVSWSTVRMGWAEKFNLVAAKSRTYRTV